MGKGNFGLHAFNRGEVSRLALGRTDVDKLRLAAEEQLNWEPSVLGPMGMRPGLQYLGATRLNRSTVHIPFIFGNSDTAALELTNGFMRVWIDDVLVTRPVVTTSVTNGDFGSASGWTLSSQADERANPVAATASITGGNLRLQADARGGTASAMRRVGVAGVNRNTEHAFRIVVERGPVLFRAGSTETNDNYIAKTMLEEGTHSLAFTPTTQDVYVYFETTELTLKIVNEITIEKASLLGSDMAVALPTPWAVANLSNIRHAQSGDIVFVACKDVHPYKIERRSARSWSVVKYLSIDGPVKAVASEKIKLLPGACTGNTTLRSNKPFFKDEHVGCIFRLFTPGQERTIKLVGNDQWSDPIRITGVGSQDRGFIVDVRGTWTGTLTLQRSMEDGNLGVGFNNTDKTYIKNGQEETDDSKSDNAAYNNTIAWYRVGFADGDYGTGTPLITFRDSHKKDKGKGGQSGGRTQYTDFGSGGGDGFVRILSIDTARSANIEILKPLPSTQTTEDWQQGFWNSEDGYPTAVAIHEGRLWWAGGDRVWGSKSDDYYSFDLTAVGDAAPISRSIGYGPIDKINWVLPLGRLILGREGSETSIRSSTLDEPITPTSFAMRDCSTKGSARAGAVKADANGIFISKTGAKAYELVADTQAAEYRAHDLTRLHPDIGGEGGFTRLAVQHQPDTSVYFVRTDGQVGVLLYDKEDEVEAWWRIATGRTVAGVFTQDVIEEVFVLPGDEEDRVYFVVARTIGGSTVRYLEKLALKSECSGRPVAKLMDSFKVDTGGDVTITGLSHLEGQAVVAWGWDNDGSAGVDLGSYTVANNKIVVSAAYDNVCVGLAYHSTFTSAKLAYAADQGTAVSQKKRLQKLGLVLYDTHYQGLRYGQRADVLDALPLVKDGATTAADTVHEEFDEPMIEVPGEWDPDARLHLKASSPRPCTVAAAVITVQTHG